MTTRANMTTRVTYVQTSGGSVPGKVFTKPAMVTCDVCLQPNLKTFIDGNTKLGGWANMCKNCHKRYGYGLGLGRGQQYDIKTSG